MKSPNCNNSVISPGKSHYTKSQIYRKIMKILRLVLGLLIPPLGVFLTVGVGPTLVINVLLTLLGWLPGSIHALWVITKHEEQVGSY
jgi:uncharacterized membrane protein YqaE (UPF0057 family)